MTKGTKWIILHSLTTPGFAHPSNGGELGAFPLWGKLSFTTDGGATPIPSRSRFPFTTDETDDSHTVTEQSSPLRRGGTKCRGGLSPETSAKGGLSRVTSNK